MLYVKNVPGWERAVRGAMGVGAMGVMAAVSGLLGFGKLER